MNLSLKQLESYRDEKRVLLIFAPSANDAGYLEQKEWLEAHNADLQERDLVVFYLLPSDATPLLEHFDITESSFTVVLIGKDGSGKERYDNPVQPKALFRTIDQMPMRRREMAEE